MIESYVGSVLQAFNKTESLQQRLGHRAWVDGSPGVGIWGRINADHASIASDGSTTGAAYQIGTARVQAGIDGLVSSNDAGAVVGGLTVQLGTVSADIQSASGMGKVSSTAYGLGAGLTWYGSEGFYLDAQGRLALFDSSLSSDTLGAAIVSGNAGLGYALSLEAGHQVALGDNWSVTPQAQLSYSRVSFDDFTDPFGSTVRLDRGDSLAGRLGISADYEAAWQDANGDAGRARFYGLANVSYELLGGTSTSIGANLVSSRKDSLWGGVGLGGSLDWADGRFSLFGEVGANTSLNNPGESYALDVTAGLKGNF